jgi:hypothetical protein
MKHKKFIPKLSVLQSVLYIPAQKHIFHAVRTFLKYKIDGSSKETDDLGI